MIYCILRPIGTILCKILFQVKAKGLEHLPKEGKVILAANHSSYLDSVVLGVVIPRRIKWIVRKDIYHLWWLKWLFVLTKMIPENGAIERSLFSLRDGEILGIFPEGTRSRDGLLHSGKEGIGILALKSAAPVIPCAILGAFEAYPPHASFPKPHPIKIIIGRPIIFETVEMPDEAMTTSAVETIMSAIRSLMEERA
ncbi:MAG: hypothetical protein AMJ78_09230 [Omnitrophica WOR_2 bacterium SM23_29]|nr:MAG: hypothetical protein AMJ78_09230 [Omnitrophica WOR_2 bacterium SM23_29]